MKKSRLLLILLTLCLLWALLVPALAADGQPAADAEEPNVLTLDAEAAPASVTPANYAAGGEELPPPEITARCALLTDLESGQTYYAKNADQRAYPASLTKIMTVLLALEAVDRGDADLSDVVTAGPDCMEGMDEDSSTAGIQEGETMSLEDLLYCAMISSANEACNVIASYIGGSIGAFVEQMNARAAELGCTGTHFTNTHGMPDENHYTTAADLRIITEAALQYPLFFEMSNTLTYSVPATNKHEARELQNTNGLINPDSVIYPGYLYEPAAGIKTGHTNAAGFCLISTAEKNTVRLLCIVLGSTAVDRGDGMMKYQNFTDSIALYDWLYNNFSIQTVVSSTEPLRDVAVEMGSDADRVTVHAQKDLTAVLPNGADLSAYERSIVIYSERDGTPLQAPVKAGDVLGGLTVQKDGQTLGTVPLVASVDVDLSRVVFLKNGLHSFFSKPLVLIVLAVVVLVLVLYIVAYVRYRRRRRRRIQEARRRRQLELEQYERERDEAVRREFEGRGPRRRR